MLKTVGFVYLCSQKTQILIIIGSIIILSAFLLSSVNSCSLQAEQTVSHDSLRGLAFQEW